MTFRPWFAGLALVLVGCGSSASRASHSTSPQAVRTPARSQPQTYPQQTRPYAPPAVAPTAQAPRVVRSNNSADPRFWRPSLEEALSDARTSGRLVFLEMGRDACGNCQALRNKVIPDPSIEGPLKVMSVGFYDDIDRNRETRARNVLQQNLPTAVILPLAGWVDPDMRWISGFSGRRDANSFLQEIAKARAIYGQRTEAERPVPRAALAEEMPAAPAPAPAPAGDGSLPAGEMADVAAALGEDVPAAAAPPTPVEVAARVEPTPALDAPAAPPAIAQPAAAPAEAPSAPPPPPAEAAHAEPAAVPSVAAPLPNAPVAVTAPTADPVREWAHAELQRAAAAVAARDYAGARAILAEVRQKAEGLPEGREADKGEVAIRALKRLERQEGEDATRTKADAARDLRGTVWAQLFA